MPKELTEPTPEPESEALPEPTPPAPIPDPPDEFPMGVEEYASVTGLHYLWAAGLAYVAGPGDRYRAEWDALLAEYKTRPVQSN